MNEWVKIALRLCHPYQAKSLHPEAHPSSLYEWKGLKRTLSNTIFILATKNYLYPDSITFPELKICMKPPC